MKIQESAENYLETILILRQRIGDVRSVDIANELGYSKPSLSESCARTTILALTKMALLRFCPRVRKLQSVCTNVTLF